MKRRTKILLPNKLVLKKSESNIDKHHFDKPLRRVNLSTSSLKQNLEFFRQNSSLFQKPTLNYGDADTYFKQSLRNYNDFDISEIFRPRRKKKSKSVETLKAAKKSASSLVHEKSKNSSKHTVEETKRQEGEGDVFYSPSSNSLQNSELSTVTLKNRSAGNSTIILTKEQDTSNIDDAVKMAEDDDVMPFYEGEEFIDDEDIDVWHPEEGAEDYIEGEEEYDMDEVEKMIKQASDELAEVTVNMRIEETQEEKPALAEGRAEEGQVAEEPRDEGKGEGEGSFFKFDPAIDSAILTELDEAEKQAKIAANVINELKARVTDLLKKEKHTEAEAKELEEKNKELKAQMILFEEKTKRIQFLLNQTNLFEKMVPPGSPLQMTHKEDVLPKVVICGVTEHNIPKLILCDHRQRKISSSEEPPKEINVPATMVPKFAKRLNDSYNMQERLAAENADLEGMRFKLQSDLLTKDQTIEYLQRKIVTIQKEMQMLFKENTILNEKAQQINSPRQEPPRQRRPKCGKNRGPCPVEIEDRLYEYSETTKLLEKQLFDMENDVKQMQSELTAVQAERQQLEQEKKVVLCPQMCMPPPPCVPCPSPCVPCPQPCSPFIVPCSDTQLRELREQYNRLQDDFKAKVTEVGFLRADNEKLKNIAKEAEEAKKNCEEKIKELEVHVKRGKPDSTKVSGAKEQYIELEQQLAVAKQRFREAQDELDELRSFVQDQQGQLNDYRNKYLEAQQEVEEQKRKIDILEMDANRVNEQVNLEIQRVKNQFQEKLQELLPLPELLKNTQLKLQEAQQMHLQAEQNNEALKRELEMYKDKIAEITNEMNAVEQDKRSGTDANKSMAVRLQEMEERIMELEDEKYDLKEKIEKLQAALEETDQELQTKLHEIVQLEAQLESVREESARQVARNKDRCETVRRSMQNQISDLERQLAITRAQGRTVQKERDEIRQKMQMQINNLHENFEDAQMRIRNLQGHVNYLRESYNPNATGDDAQKDQKNSPHPSVV